ncbi:MAG TPA: M36 family metallopeptidase [Kofleriaceae bacterium]|nr:M36 family metallopeptidase [Kofleriaceae bacterium]
MRFRLRALVVPSFLFAAACSGDSPSTTPDDPAAPEEGQAVPPTEQRATALGVSIVSSDDAGAPRLIRAIVPLAAPAGMAPGAAAREHVAALKELWVAQGQTTDLVERSTQPLRNGANVVTLAQEVDGIPVSRGELHVLLHTDGRLAAVSGTLMASAAKPHFVSSSREALGHALDKQYGAARAQPPITEEAAPAGDADGWQTLTVASTPDLQVESARARRELAKIGDGLAAVWRVEVMGTGAFDPMSDSSPFYAHDYLVTDDGGEILLDTDLVQNDAFVYRVYAATTGNRRPLDGPFTGFSPHPTGVPDGSVPALTPQSLVVMEAFNGPLDPWLPVDATTTSGNNAEAFADMDGTNNASPSDIRPEVRAGRVLNYTYDHEIGPLDTPDQSKAAAVNAFYLVNWLHDWWYDSGFTEATHNAQRDNFGRGGTANDPMLVLAQAGANIGNRNNANMGTPADGGRPRMRMYLWSAPTTTSLDGPGGPLPSEAIGSGPRNFDLQGDLAIPTDTTAPFDDACQRITSDVTGKIVLTTFSGVCNSANVVANAKAAGAAGVMIEDPAGNNPRGFGGNGPSNLPGLAIGAGVGESLKAALAMGTVTVTMHSVSMGVERDGDLDNTVVAHEWGHYLHHRLAACGAQQCSGMSEGWGDFNALMMMLREGDDRDGAYPAAIYAVADGTPNSAYFGIRRYPYSRDHSKDPRTFKHIGDENPLPGALSGAGNSEVHATGEIWATMMWEVLNVLADQHGVNIARRRMSDYVVAGLLLAPPNATFTEQRDALLAAASALDTDDMLLMAAAFAGRGAGSCAVSPSNSSATNAGVVESGTLAGKFGLGGLTLVDDGISCDHDGYLDPGESGTLHLSLANNGIIAAENVTVTATTTATGVRIGAPIKITALQPFTSSSLAIPVTVLQTAPRNTLVTIRVHVAGDNTCTPSGVDASLTIRTGADDVPTSSATERAETQITVWTPTGTGAANLWGRARDASGNRTFFAANAESTTDTQYVSPLLQASPTAPVVINLKHAYSLEGDASAFFDGGVIEVSTDGGATWRDAAALGANPGYNATLVGTGGNPLRGRMAYSGTSAGFPALQPLELNFGNQFAGTTFQIRFRLGTDGGGALVGWLIDDITVHGLLNTPFPILVAEAATCTARKAALDDSALAEVGGSPAVSLDAFDRAVCVLNEALP